MASASVDGGVRDILDRGQTEEGRDGLSLGDVEVTGDEISEVDRYNKMLMAGREATEYYVIETLTEEIAADVSDVMRGKNGEVFRVVQRLNVNLMRVLRSEDFSEQDIISGLDSGRFTYLTRSEFLNKFTRENAGIGITGGGDCAGIADCLSGFEKGLDPEFVMMGVKNAGAGLSAGSEEFGDRLIVVDALLAKDFEGQSSTPFGSSRVDPLKANQDQAQENIGGHKFFFGTGGNDHLGLLERVSKLFPEMIVVGTFKSIDGDGWINGEPAQMLGFDSAMRDYQSAIWAAVQNAATHEQATVIEVFGRNCGKLAFEAARSNPKNFAALTKEAQRKINEFADTLMILAPERPTSLRSVAEEVGRRKKELGSCVTVVSEGFLPPELKSEIDRLAHNQKLFDKWRSGELRVEEISGLVEDADLKELLKDGKLAVQFAETLWEGRKDAFGNSIKLAGIRHFVIAAIKKLGGVSKVNEMLENYEARGVEPSEYDRVMGQKIGASMAQVVNEGTTGGKAVVYLEGMDAMTQEPVVVDLVGVSDKNNLNNPDMYPNEMLRENGVFWKEAA